MKTLITVFCAVILLAGCVSIDHFDYKNVTYKEVQKQVLGYGFSKSMNEEMAKKMAEATARKNIAEQLAGMQFVYTSINGVKEMKLSIRDAKIADIKLDKNIRLDMTGVLISVLKSEKMIKKPAEWPYIAANYGMTSPKQDAEAMFQQVLKYSESYQRITMAGCALKRNFVFACAACELRDLCISFSDKLKNKGIDKIELCCNNPEEAPEVIW